MLSARAANGSSTRQSVKTSDGRSSLSFGPSLFRSLGLARSDLTAAKTINWNHDPHFRPLCNASAATAAAAAPWARAWSGVATFELQQQAAAGGSSSGPWPLTVTNLSEPLSLVLPAAPGSGIRLLSEGESGAGGVVVVRVACSKGVVEQKAVQCRVGSSDDAPLSLTVRCVIECMPWLALET